MLGVCGGLELSGLIYTLFPVSPPFSTLFYSFLLFSTKILRKIYINLSNNKYLSHGLFPVPPPDSMSLPPRPPPLPPTHHVWGVERWRGGYGASREIAREGKGWRVGGGRKTRKIREEREKKRSGGGGSKS